MQARGLDSSEDKWQSAQENTFLLYRCSTLEEVAQRGWGVSSLVDIQNSAGPFPEQPALTDPLGWWGWTR